MKLTPILKGVVMMKKMIRLLAAALLLIALLAGCTPKDPAPATAPTEPSTAPTEPPTMPVEEDVRYFVNQMEYNRLYSVREDGTDLKLVLDKYCYSARQSGDSVYYMVGSTLERYHIPTGTCTLLANEVLDFDVSGSHLVYAVSTENYGEVDLLHRDLSDNRDASIAVIDSARFWTGYDRVYYGKYDYDNGGEILYVHDLSTGRTQEITRDFFYYGSVLPTEDGAYFEGGSPTQDGWFFAPADGSGISLVQLDLEDLSELLYVSDSSTLYLSRDPETYAATLHHVAGDGTDTILAAGDESTLLYFSAISDDHWVVRKEHSIGWGEIGEYGYYDRYAYRTEHLLLTKAGTLTPLDTTGAVGSMFPDGDFPLLDSSTARIPVTSSLYELFVLSQGHEGPEPLCSTTHGAWLNIADRKVDLAFLAAPTPEEQAYLEEKGVSVEMKLYGGDGLVFIGNANNPVSDLTHEQILAIYRGEITNWSQLGGPDHPIIVYYRDEQSGSQRLFKNLVFKGEEIPDFDAIAQENENFWLWDDMGSIVDMILEEPYAIGYSIMTYLDEVYAEEDMMVFTVDGVLPATQTIADGSYRYHTQGYLVMRSDEPASSPARRLFDWFGCPTSDDLLNHNDVTPLHE